MADTAVGGAYDPNRSYPSSGGGGSGETFQNATLNGTTTIATGATITAPAIVGATVTGTVTVGAGATLTSPALVAPAITGAATIATGATITTAAVVTPTITTGLLASGSAANDFSASTGTFLTSSGANTLSGAVTVGDATTPSVTTASGKTNTGFFKVNGKTSGSLKVIAADATAQDITLTTAAQTSGAATLTIPDMAGSAKTVAWLQSPSFTTPALGVATGTSLAATGLLTSSSASAGIGYATNAGGAGTQGTNRTTTVVMSPNPCLCGSITLFSAAGSATPASFTVTNSAVAATDTIIVNQKSGTDKYEIFVTTVGTGSFQITSFTTGGTTTESPVFNFAVLKAVAS